MGKEKKLSKGRILGSNTPKWSKDLGQRETSDKNRDIMVTERGTWNLYPRDKPEDLEKCQYK